ncbi:MAG: hypothetical protein HYV36_04010 [Lentisphaerae bacterium]|nr:hypothetical protein [Lentisphaerota bacterium]
MDAMSWVLFIAGIILGIFLIVLPRRLRAGLGDYTGLLGVLRFLGVFIVGAMFLWAEFISGLSGFTGINIHRLRNPTLFTVTFFVFLSTLIVMILEQIRWTWLRSSLITQYFCLVVFAFILIRAMDYSHGTGWIMEELRRSSVATAENVRILKLLRSSNAVEVNSNQYKWVVHMLEHEIDCLLPVANDYLVNRLSLRWRFPDYLWGDTYMTVCFQRDFPSVVEYRKTHPPVWNHGHYEEVMRKYAEETDLSRMYSPNFDKK